MKEAVSMPESVVGEAPLIKVSRAGGPPVFQGQSR
jgi:hypothetical protein